ncbi:MAG: 23S rRNA (uracil(1939)-C(5))-methyltransferase RlmD [Candidatus Delongbacteria bacterium]|nr:23S rRNA (uracil(1939)-C(5))-methyltransferase RlmD [Candidatus Delongbacteria bacterium]MBN2837107.1 23S rRNA (uracil(1939)-C(5))-methyltransferase RlmD [Candidatus Delongbacteria bacterium]
MKYDLLELVAGKAIYGGKTLSNHGTKKVILERALPGEKVMAYVKQRKKGYLECVAKEFIERSPHRKPHECAYYPYCGGCKMLDVEYSFQLKLKEDAVTDCITRIGKIEDYEKLDIVPSPKDRRYRNKMEFTFSNLKYYFNDEIRDENDVFFLGFHAPKIFNKVIDINHCYLQSEKMNEIFNSLKSICKESGYQAYDVVTHEGFFRYLVMRETFDGKVMINIVTKRFEEQLITDLAKKFVEDNPSIVSIVNTINKGMGNTAYGDESYLIYGEEKVYDYIGKYKFEISVNSFFQVNPFQTENLYNKAFEIGEIQKGDKVIDLYCGVGTISLFAAEKASVVTGFELVENAVLNARKNADINGVTNCDFFSGDLMSIVQERSIFKEKNYDVIITDPPRDGMHPKVINSIVKSGIKKIIYISCNPSTFARDAEMLEAGGYKLFKAGAVDMFPNTYHVEVVSVFEKI